MNPLETLIQQLMQQAGPRGSTFAGRVIPQGAATPSLRQVMAQQPTESPDAEGMGGAALAAGGGGMLKRGMTQIPPVPEGYIRLYRGQSGKFEPLTPNPPLGQSERGRWFSTDQEAARFHGPDMQYVDVPQSVANSSVVEDSLFNQTGRLLPVEWANKALKK